MHRVDSNLMSRRAALQIGAGMFGLSLPGYLRALRANPSDSRRRDVSCIFLFLAGGISHFESWDPKPDAQENIRGPWNPAATSVPGVFITEKMPLLAQRMHKVAIVRSWQGVTGGHDLGSQHVMSGFMPRGQQYYPNFGCVVGALKGTQQKGIPPYVGVPLDARYTNPTGYLGPAYSALNIAGDPSAPDFQVKGLNIPGDRFEDRQGLLRQINNLGQMAQAESPSLSAHDEVYDSAVSTLTSGAIQRATQVSDEPLSLRQRYGMNIYGQRVLLARRLVEAGARFVTINQAVQGGLFGAGQTNGTWDNHDWLFDSMMSFASPPRGVADSKWHSYAGPGNLPQLDMSLSALLDDLDQRGLLDTTLVVAMGEFGRTPRINANAGRDHYPRAGCVLLAGAGIRGGAVIGATDRNGIEPITRPHTPADFAASIYHALGIPHHTSYFPRLPRPTPLADGEVIHGLFA